MRNVALAKTDISPSEERLRRRAWSCGTPYAVLEDDSATLRAGDSRDARGGLVSLTGAH
jgi:hypothetical protein